MRTARFVEIPSKDNKRTLVNIDKIVRVDLNMSTLSFIDRKGYFLHQEKYDSPEDAMKAYIFFRDWILNSTF